MDQQASTAGQVLEGPGDEVGQRIRAEHVGEEQQVGARRPGLLEQVAGNVLDPVGEAGLGDDPASNRDDAGVIEHHRSESGVSAPGLDREDARTAAQVEKTPET